MVFNTCYTYIRYICYVHTSNLELIKAQVRSVMDATRSLGLFLVLVLSLTINGESSACEQGDEMLLSAKFKKYPSHSLLANILKSMSVLDFFDCTHFCLATKRCVSFNIQAKPDHSRRYHCELLETDLFNSPYKFQGNGSFHHYALQTPCMEQNPCKKGEICLPDYQMNSYICKSKPAKSCSEHHKAGNTTSGVYEIDPDGLGPFDVFCDQTTGGGGWTVFQKRLDGSVDFYRGWADYKQGFGDLCDKCEFWLGLDKIHRLTSQTNNILRVELEDFDGNTAYAEYDMFAVSDEASKYQLSVEDYSGTAGDSLSIHRGMAFSTKDRENDKRSYANCAVIYKGAWWYNDCHHSNLNGLYHHGQHSSHADGVNWRDWKGHRYSAKRAEMKIRPVGF